MKTYGGFSTIPTTNAFPMTRLESKRRVCDYLGTYSTAQVQLGLAAVTIDYHSNQVPYVQPCILVFIIFLNLCLIGIEDHHMFESRCTSHSPVIIVRDGDSGVRKSHFPFRIFVGKTIISLSFLAFCSFMIDHPLFLLHR